MTQLAWFPFVTDEWRDIVRDLSIEEEGALLRAARAAWSAEIPGTLADRPAAWDNLLGSRARALTDVVRRFFVPHPEHDGRLHWPWLTALYQLQLGKYESAAKRGAQGGKRKAENAVTAGTAAAARSRRRSSSATSTATSSASSTATNPPTTEVRGGNPPALKGPGDTPPAPSAPRAALQGAQRHRAELDDDSVLPPTLPAGTAPPGWATSMLEPPRLGQRVRDEELQRWAARHQDIVSLVEAEVAAELATYADDDVLVQASRRSRMRRALEAAYLRSRAGEHQLGLPITAEETGASRVSAR